MVLVPVLLPVSVRLPAPAIAPVLLKVIGPVPDALIEMLAPRVKSRSVLCPVPLYWRAPPLRTRLEAALEEAPMALG
jgi:hypothetical protein